MSYRKSWVDKAFVFWILNTQLHFWEGWSFPSWFSRTFRNKKSQQLYLKSIIWDCSKEGRVLSAITQARTCGKIAYLKKNRIVNVRQVAALKYIFKHICLRSWSWDLIHVHDWKLLTMGNLNKPITSAVAIENVEKESPTIPKTGGAPKQLSWNGTSSSWPVAIDKAALNPITSVAQLS